MPKISLFPHFSHSLPYKSFKFFTKQKLVFIFFYHICFVSLCRSLAFFANRPVFLNIRSIRPLFCLPMSDVYILLRKLLPSILSFLHFNVLPFPFFSKESIVFPYMLSPRLLYSTAPKTHAAIPAPERGLSLFQNVFGLPIPTCTLRRTGRQKAAQINFDQTILGDHAWFSSNEEAIQINFDRPS